MQKLSLSKILPELPISVAAKQGVVLVDDIAYDMFRCFRSFYGSMGVRLSNIFGGNLKTGLFVATVFPLIMVLGLVVLNQKFNRLSK